MIEANIGMIKEEIRIGLIKIGIDKTSIDPLEIEIETMTDLEIKDMIQKREMKTYTKGNKEKTDQ